MGSDRFKWKTARWLRRYPAHLLRYRQFRELTMMKRRYYVDNLFLAEEVMRDPELREGSVIECGTWAGGMSFGLMQTLRQTREFHCFDSFEGLPEPDERDGELAITGIETGVLKHDNNTAAYEPFAENVERYRAPDQQVHIHKGWFQDTLPKFESEREIAILRLDGDWYESTMVVLEHLFDRVMHGGLILIDDYHFWDGCSRAVHDFLASRSALERLRESRSGVAYMIRQRRPAKTAS